MSTMTLFAAAFFLTLFPLSMAFNSLFSAAKRPLLRIVLVLAWPQIGIFMLHTSNTEVPGWLVSIGLATAGFYALRMLVVREMHIWIAYLATGLWAIQWLFAPGDPLMSHLFALSLSLPLAILVLIAHAITTRFGAAYAGIPGGFGVRVPRLASLLVVATLVAIGTPPAAPFFTLMAGLLASTLAHAIGLLCVWLLWSWAAIRLIQGMVVGEADENTAKDISPVLVWLFAMSFIALIAAGLWFAGSLA